MRDGYRGQDRGCIHDRAFRGRDRHPGPPPGQAREPRRYAGCHRTPEWSPGGPAAGAGQPVVPGKPNAIKTWRDGEVLSGAKSDAGDAAVIAEYLRLRQHKLKVAAPYSETFELDRARAANRMPRIAESCWPVILGGPWMESIRQCDGGKSRDQGLGMKGPGCGVVAPPGGMTPPVSTSRCFRLDDRGCGSVFGGVVRGAVEPAYDADPGARTRVVCGWSLPLARASL
jgi:hypothetical protein